MDTAYLLDGANPPLRRAHVITMTAWIGSSFYFVFPGKRLRGSSTGTACHLPNAQLRSKGLALSAPELIEQQAQATCQPAATLELMPFNDATQITAQQRTLIKRWFAAGASTP